MALTGLRLAAASLLLAGSVTLAAPARRPVIETTVPALKPAPAPAPAKKSGPQILVSADGETVYLTGMLGEGSFLKFEAVLRDAPKVRRLVLGSIGGLTVEGRLIAALVRKRRLDTHVEFYCASACTQVFVSGRERVIGPKAKLGFHQAVVVDKQGQAKGVRPATERKLHPTLIYGINGNDTLRLAYEQAGIEPAFITKVLETRHADMWGPSAQELLAARVITRQATAAELALPGGGPGASEVRALLGGKVLWRQAALSVPRDHAEAVDEVWLWANSGVSLGAAIAVARARLMTALTPRLLSASDAQLGRLLALRGRTAREQRALDYPDCSAADPLETARNSSSASSADSAEDRLIAEIVTAPSVQKPPSREEAQDTFWKEVMPAFAKAYRRGDTESDKALCGYSLRVIEEIDALPADRRIKAYRSMLALPDWAKS
ncbi:MAG: hypothetical protein RL299_923 [Pseudomonadota bacterium]|jgi:hypothetical protein